MPDLGGLQEKLGHSFNNPDLLIQALTHSSATLERKESNERLEFLGDRVLGLALAGMLLETFPDEAEGKIAYRFSALARAESLTRVAAEVDLAPHIRLARGEEDKSGRQNPGILADCCEAVIAALYLDGGYETAEKFVHQYWRPLMSEDLSPPKDAKTLLQEWAQAKGMPLPVYRVAASEGPAHAPLFTVEASVHEMKPATGQGPSKQVAEQTAAETLMNRINEKP
ncbi:MAG: ribonuclease III [Alphaproteobacteria bacterium]|nr:ribonuclease III [Alphaproteobacteria bacterium]MBT7941740.1 ribonuclease III [Alphaproteobacteria bacterium]